MDIKKEIEALAYCNKDHTDISPGVYSDPVNPGGYDRRCITCAVNRKYIVAGLHDVAGPVLRELLHLIEELMPPCGEPQSVDEEDTIETAQALLTALEETKWAMKR